MEGIIFDKSFSLRLDSSNRYIVAFYETSVLKEVCILRMLSPQCRANNGEVLIPKKSSRILNLCLINFCG